MNIPMKLVYQDMAIFFTFSPTSNHLHPLQVENCDSNSRPVVDEDDNVKSGLKGLLSCTVSFFTDLITPPWYFLVLCVLILLILFGRCFNFNFLLRYFVTLYSYN